MMVATLSTMIALGDGGARRLRTRPAQIPRLGIRRHRHFRDLPRAVVAAVHPDGRSDGETRLDDRHLGALVVVYPTFLVPFVTWLMSGYFRTIPTELDLQVPGGGTIPEPASLSLLALAGAALLTRRRRH